MTTDEIERLAAGLEEMPDGLDTPDQMLFLTLRELYGNFRSGYVNRERAKREKSRIYVAYYELKNQYTIMEQHLGIRRRLQNTIGDVYQCGCENCRKLLNVFVGIDREDIPTDIKEINAVNAKLREMVKERSERNAYLATVIDRVRWALEKNDIERAREIINDHRDN